MTARKARATTNARATAEWPIHAFFAEEWGATLHRINQMRGAPTLSLSTLHFRLLFAIKSLDDDANRNRNLIFPGGSHAVKSSQISYLPITPIESHICNTRAGHLADSSIFSQIPPGGVPQKGGEGKDGDVAGYLSAMPVVWRRRPSAMQEQRQIQQQRQMQVSPLRVTKTRASRCGRDDRVWVGWRRTSVSAQVPLLRL